MITALLIACGSAWDSTRREDSAEIVLTVDDREVDTSFDVAATIYLQAADDGDTDTATFDTGWSDTTGVSIDVDVQVKEATGEGRVRFLAWGGQATDVVPPPVEFVAGDRPTVFHDTMFCAARDGTCSMNQRATVDLREGGPMTVVLRLTVDASADEESAKYISDETDYTLGFR